jgi:hypothetical protein
MSDDQTVYVVFSGYYSDKGVDAVFSTEDAARRYCDAREFQETFSKEHYYESYVLDPLDRIAEGRIWHVVDFDPDGTVTSVVPDSRTEFPGIYGIEVEATSVEAIDADDDDHQDVPAERVKVSARTASGKEWLRVWVEARDPEHAVKIASEKRAEYLARQAGIS